MAEPLTNLAIDTLAQDRPAATFVLGVPISLVTVETATQRILQWAKQRGPGRYVCVRDVHGVMLAQDDPALMRAHQEADMVTPDGMPLAVIARRRHPGAVARTCGADLFDATLRAGLPQGTRHFFFGGKPGIAEELARKAIERNPGLVIAGTGTPSFGPVSAKEDDALTQQIADAAPDVVWVGLSTPKQEMWMSSHHERLPGAILIGVGAVFDFYVGAVRRSPRWVSRAGFEWLYRLSSEPRRLWRRYLIVAPRFLVSIAKVSRTTAARRPR